LLLDGTGDREQLVDDGATSGSRGDQQFEVSPLSTGPSAAEQ